MIPKMSRWVQRTGRRVEFGNVVMGHCGSPYAYEFPDEATAKKFASFAKKTDKSGMPVAIPEGQWEKYFFKGRHA